jgi:hypothetical protein
VSSELQKYRVMSRTPSQETIWIGFAIEAAIATTACAAVFMSPIHWTLKLGFAASLALITLMIDTQDAESKWAREINTILLTSLAERLDRGISAHGEHDTLAKAMDAVQSRVIDIRSGGGEAEYVIIVFQLRCALWFGGGYAFAYFLGPAILRAYP